VDASILSAGAALRGTSRVQRFPETNPFLGAQTVACRYTVCTLSQPNPLPRKTEEK
jgi:hypothetical protein